jgi:hypothetical protein
MSLSGHGPLTGRQARERDWIDPHHYRVIGALGRGSMSEVYAVEDATLRRQVALRVLDRRRLFNRGI